MKSTHALALFTFREVLAQPIYRILCSLSFIFVAGSLILSNLFLFETSKVLVDLIWLSLGLISFIYVLFVACTMLAQDIGHQMVYLFIPQLSRNEYLLGRLLGLFLAFLLLTFLALLFATLAIYWSTSATTEAYHHGINIWTALPLILIAILQGIVALALVLFVCSWATSQAEMLVFSCAFIVFFSIFPAVIEVLQSSEIIANTPATITLLIQAVSFLFPKLSASSFAIAQAHGIAIPMADWMAFIASYIGYSILALCLAFFIFSKRDL